MEKEAKKRPAARREEEEGKNSKPRPNDEEVEQFFALIRRIRSTAQLIGKENGRSPTFRWEGFVDCFHNPVPDSGVAKAGSEKGEGSGRSSCDESPTVSREEEEEEEEKRESIEDNGLTGWFDLNVEAPATKEKLL